MTINSIYTYASIAIGFIADLLFLIFVLITFQRIDRNPEQFSGNKDNIKLGIISTLILIIVLSIFGIAFVILEVFYGIFGIILLSETVANVLFYTLLGFVILSGIFYIVVFVVLGNFLAANEKLHDLQLFNKYTRIFGIFMGIYYVLLGLTFATLLIPSIGPVFSIILSIFLSSNIIINSIISISAIIMAAGFITIGRKLQ